LLLTGLTAAQTLAPDVRDVLKGQFFFLRAYTYFKLVRLYGGVPLVFVAHGVDDEDLRDSKVKNNT
jgi:hypothetical protein